MTSPNWGIWKADSANHNSISAGSSVSTIGQLSRRMIAAPLFLLNCIDNFIILDDRADAIIQQRKHGGLCQRKRAAIRFRGALETSSRRLRTARRAAFAPSKSCRRSIALLTGFLRQRHCGTYKTSNLDLPTKVFLLKQNLRYVLRVA